MGKIVAFYVWVSIFAPFLSVRTKTILSALYFIHGFFSSENKNIEGDVQSRHEVENYRDRSVE